MQKKTHLLKLKQNCERRKQALEEQLALEGLSADPRVQIEIEDLEEKIKGLQLKLQEMITSSEGGELDQGLLIAYPQSINVGDHNISLLHLVEQYDRGELQIPYFQREPGLWAKYKVTQWIRSVINQSAIGVIVTYQLKGGNTIWLADGLQRLSATQKFLDSPSTFGFQFGREQSKRYIQNFFITRQHREYPEHLAAMKAFHNLNSGLPLTPEEYYKGELCLDKRGLIVYKKLPTVLEKHEEGLVSTGKLNRLSASTIKRDCFALFLQYISDTRIMNFWEVATREIHPDLTPLEVKIIEFFNEKRYSTSDVEAQIKNFDKFIADQIKLLYEIKEEIGKKDQRINKTTTRWLLHLAIWRRNTRRPASLYREFVKGVLREASTDPTFGSRSIKVSKPDGKTTNVAIKVGSLHPAITQLEDLLRTNLYIKKREDTKSQMKDLYS